MNGTPVRVLVVDDDADGAEAMAMAFQLDGHEVATANDPLTALERARRLRPRVVLLDLALSGGLDGYELARRLRWMPGMEGACLIAVTGHASEEHRRRAHEAGFDSFLAKPVDLSALRQLAGRLLRRLRTS